MFLNCHSWFSLKYGVLRPGALLEEAARAGVTVCALTDIHCTAGVPDFVRDAPKHGVRPVVGIEFRQGSHLLYIGLARNNEGFQALNTLLSTHLLDGTPLPERPPLLEHTYFILPFTTPHRTLLPHERIGVRPSDLTRLPFSPWARSTKDLVAWMPVTFRDPGTERHREFDLHRLLRTVAHNTVLSLLPPEELARPDEVFRSSDEVMRIYQDHPHLLQNTMALLEECTIAFDTSDKTWRSFGADEREDRERLHADALRGLHTRYGRPSQRALERLRHELDVIDQKGFVSYFRINQDIVDFARSRGFFHVGRGSGANSLVAYCLGITDVDPLELDLYFERFINPARRNPPDFDIDFSWKDRDEVYRYIFSKYNGPGAGRIHAAQIATYTTFQWRGAVRELGKALGLPPGEIDALSAGDEGGWGGGHPSAQVRAGTMDRVARAVVRHAQRLIGMPHQFGIHAGGVVITEQPVTHFTALHRPPKGFPVTQISMLECEDLGLHKFDLLSQRGLGHIRDAVEMVNATAAEPIDIHDIPRFKQDPAIKELLRKGDTIGCFYVESPAMRMLLKKLRVEDYLGLVAASSIIRPGVAESGMMREYLLRHHDPERRKQAPKRLLEIMPETYGVMVYQEDVIKVAVQYGGLNLSEADQVRRGMNLRYRERDDFKEVERKFFANCQRSGHPPQEVEEIWRQIESFASFSFAKGHSASYAVESYQSLYLKAHHPLEFLVAVANNFGGFYRTEFYLHEAKRAGAVIEAPCVNMSGEWCSLMRTDRRIHLGLAHIKGLTSDTVHAVLDERRRHGPFTDLQDLLRRVPLELEQARLLVRAGALRFTGRSKPQLLWDLALLHRPARVGAGHDLFTTRVEEPALPPLHHHPLADAYDELELLGFPLCDPFTLVDATADTIPTDLPHIGARDMPQHIGRRVAMRGYLIHVKTTTTHYGQRMTFGSFIDPAGDFWDSTQFPQVAARHPFRGRGVYLLTGVVEEEFGHCALRTERFMKLPWKPDPRYGAK